MIIEEVKVPAQADGSWSHDLLSNVQRVEIYGARHGPPDFPVEHFRKGDKPVMWKHAGADAKGNIKLYAPEVDGLSVHGMARGDSVTLKIYRKEVV